MLSSSAASPIRFLKLITKRAIALGPRILVFAILFVL